MTESNQPSQTAYLQTVADTEQSRVHMLNWAEYLVHKTGVDGALRSLTYYENIGWISPAVLERMTDYVSDMDGADADEDDVRPEGELINHLEGTPFELHAGSLQYIANLANHDIEEQLLDLYTTDDRIGNRRRN